MKKIVFFVFLFFIFIWNTFANIQITGEEENIKNLVSVENGVVVIQGDIIISDYTQIDYDLKVLGDVEIQTHVKLLKDLEVEGNLEIWDYSQSYGKITAKNILTNNSFRWDILQADNIVLWGNNSVVGGFYTTENFEAGSNFLSKWNSFVGWDFKVSMGWEISGNLVVLWNARGHFDFIFDGKKMVVRGNFRTLEDSKLSGRIYMFADEGHKYKYGNKLWKYRYQFSKLIYKDFFGAVDPFLQYDLSDKTLISVRNIIQKYDYELKNIQESYVENLSTIWEYEINLLEKKAQKILEDKFEYIETFVGENAWQRTQLKKLYYEQKRALTTVFAQLERY